MHANCFGDKYSYILFACTIVTFHKLYVANDTGIAKARSICPGVVCLSWLWNNLVTQCLCLEVFISFAMNEPKLLTYFDLLSFFFKTKYVFKLQLNLSIAVKEFFMCLLGRGGTLQGQKMEKWQSHPNKCSK